MPFIPLALPPGIVRPGTKYDARGRWFDGTLIRWHEGILRPWGGWLPIQWSNAGTLEDIDLGEPIRALRAWRDNAGTQVFAMGTPTALWAFREGVLTDITPAGFTTGSVDAMSTSGQFGQGAFGAGPFGVGTQGLETISEADTWQLDVFGEILLAVATSDGNLYEWTNPATTNDAVQVSNSPVNNRGVVVTPERFVVALGAGGDDRRIEWSDQENRTVWTPTATNQAGGFTLTTLGGIQAGRRSQSETLIWTDVDIWRMRFIGGTDVYSVQQAGSNAGAISRNSMVMLDNSAIWMGQRNFFSYDGFVRPLPSDVADFVFGDINREQASKITAYSRAQFQEVVWHYPSGSSVTNDRYVSYNFAEGHWSIGRLNRTAGEDRGAFEFPMAADVGGKVYAHENVSGTYLDPVGAALVPFVESGPIEIGRGDNVMMVRHVIPDTNTLGAANLTLFGSIFPVEVEQAKGPFSLANPTSVRLTARQVRMRIDQVQNNWRLGTMRLEAVTGGGR